MHTIGTFTAVEPIPIVSYCAAVRFRFAISECQYLHELRDDVLTMLGDHNVLCALPGRVIPSGGLNSPPILQSLLEAL